MLLFLTWLASLSYAGTCDRYGEAEFILDTTGIEAAESSGLAASRTRPGVFFTHDDSGTESQLYSFSLDGLVSEAHFIDGGTLRDWEDMAAGPCPASFQAEHAIEHCLYIGDIGDNPRTRDEVQILVLAEPSAGASLQVLETWRLRYPGEPQDSETLLIHPGTGQIALVTKTWTGTAEVYAVPAPPQDGELATLERIAELSIEGGDPSGSLFTGGDWDMDGERIVLRTYGQLYLWETDPCDPNEHWSRSPARLSTTWEWQGEAICFDLEGGILTSSEGSPMPVSRLTCEEWTPGEGPCSPESGGTDTASAEEEPDDGHGTGGGHPSAALDSDTSSCGRSAVAPFLLTLWALRWPRRRRDPSVTPD